MKKFTAILLAITLVLNLAVPAFAANETSKRTDLSFTYVPEPTYTVEIPAKVDLHYGETEIPIKLLSAENLNGKTVAVTFEGTQENSNNFYLRNGDAMYVPILNYTLYVFTKPNWEGGEFWATDEYSGMTGKDFIGRTMVAFDEPGEGAYYLEITDEPESKNMYYYGTIIYGIKLV